MPKSWFARIVTAALAAGLLSSVPALESQAAPSAPVAKAGAGPQARATPRDTLPFHGFKAASDVPMQPPIVKASRPAVKRVTAKAIAGPGKTAKVAGGGVVALADPVADSSVLFARPGYALGDTSLMVYFNKNVATDTSWTTWQAVITDVQTGTQQTSTIHTRADSICNIPADFCSTFTASGGFTLVPGRPYTVTIRVFLPNGTPLDSLPSGPSQARAVIDPPELPADQASGCACPNVLTQSPGVQALRGDLVNTGTGAYVRTERDAGVSSYGIPFQAVRLYGSTKAHAGMFGPGWSWTYDVLVQPLTGGNVRVWAEDGASAVYTPSGNGGYNRPLRVQSKLAQQGTGWVLTTTDQRILTFDSTGRLTSIKNKRGFGVTLAYDTGGRLATATDAAGRVVRFITSATGTTAGYITKMTLADGRSISYGYTTSGLLSTVTDARLQQWKYGYDTGNRLSTVTDPTATVIARVTYGADTRVTTQADAAGSTIRYTWNAGTQTATATDDDGVGSTDFYRKGLLVSTRNGNGDTLNVRYDPSLNANLSVDAAGNQTDVEHDGDGNVTQVRAPDPFGYVETNSYENNNLVNHKDGREHNWKYGYNANNEMTSQADPEQVKNKVAYVYTYDNRGLVLTRKDARGKTTTYEYDAAGNRTAEIMPSGRRTEFSYDSSGRLLTVTDPRGTGNVSALTRASYTTIIVYDAEDRVLSQLQPGKKLPYVWTYDANGQATTAIDPLLRTTTWRRDDAGRVTAIVDAKGRQTKYTYTAAGRAASVTDPSAAKTSWTYEIRGRVRTEISPRGNELAASGASAATVALYTSTFDYDPAGNLKQTTRPNPDNPGGTPVKVNSEFDQLNRPKTQIDELGGTTRMEYDAAGNISDMTDENGKHLLFSYDEANHREGGTDVDGRTAAAITYDAIGNVLTQTSSSPSKGITVWDYDDDGRPVGVTEPRGNVTGAVKSDYTTRYTYDLAGNLSQITDPLGNVSEQVYDATNRVTESIDPNGNTTRAIYDDADQPVAVFGPTAKGTAQDYLAAFKAATTSITSKGPVSGTIIADGSLVSPTSFALTSLAALAGIPVTRYAFDATGDTVATADQLSRIRWTGYDAVDRPVAQADPLGRIRRMTYDADGNTTTVRAASNRPDILLTSAQKAALTTTLTYNPVGWLTRSEQGTGPTNTYGYDASGRVTSMADPNGLSTIKYGATGLVENVTRGTRVFGYEYDSDDNITKRTYPDGTSIQADYDAGDRMKSLTTTRGGSAQTFGFAYDVADRLTTTTYPGSTGATETLTYDRAGRLSNVASASGPGVKATYNLTRDAAGNPTQIATSRSDGGGAPTVAESRAYTYDASNRLTNACYGATKCGLTDPFAEKYSYGYDLVGNRTSQVNTKTGAGPLGTPAITTTAYLYDAADQLKSETALGANPKLVLYDYDGEGNQTKAGNDTFSYNLDHTLASATVGGTTSAFAYDASGNRIAATSGSGANQQTRSWEWDTLNPMPMLAVESTNAGGASAGAAGGKAAATSRAYAYGASGQTLGLYAGGTTGANGSVYTHDWLGGTANVLAASGAGQWAYDYDPFGSPRGTSLVGGGRKLSVSAPANPLQFTGAYDDEAVNTSDALSGAGGNYHLRARDYDAGTGRFTGNDPMVGGAGSVGVSSYVYVGNQATSATDLSGMACKPTAADDCANGAMYSSYDGGVDAGGDGSNTSGDTGNTGNTVLPDEYQAALDALNAQKAAASSLVSEAESFTKQLGDELIHLVMEVIGITDAISCVRDGDIGACISTALNAVPWGKLFKAAKVAFKALGLGRRLIEGYSHLRAARVALQAIADRAAALTQEGMKAGKKAIEEAKALAAKKAAQARAAAQRAREVAARAKQAAADAAAKARAAKQHALEKIRATRRPGTTCNSFSGDTRVLMGDGSTKAIEDVEPGDTVLAGPSSVADEDQAVTQAHAADGGKDSGHTAGTLVAAVLPGSQTPVARQVTATITGQGTKQLVDLTLVGAGAGGGGPPPAKPSVLTATDGHPLWTAEHGWTRASNIQPGDHLLGVGDVAVAVTAVSHHTAIATVHNLTIDDRHTYYVEAGDQTVLVHNCGGVYSLKDADGTIVRTGRTKDLARRQAQHANDPELGQFEFNVEHQTDIYAEQRGLEQMVYDANPQARAVNGGYNKIRPISPFNPRRRSYLDAARNFLERQG